MGFERELTHPIPASHSSPQGRDGRIIVLTTTSDGTYAKPRLQGSDWIFGILFAIAALAAIGLSIANAPQYRAAYQAAIDLENATICARLGFAPENSRYGACVAALSDVRTNSARRNDQSVF